MQRVEFAVTYYDEALDKEILIREDVSPTLYDFIHSLLTENEVLLSEIEILETELEGTNILLNRFRQPKNHN